MLQQKLYGNTSHDTGDKYYRVWTIMRTTKSYSTSQKCNKNYIITKDPDVRRHSRIIVPIGWLLILRYCVLKVFFMNDTYVLTPGNFELWTRPILTKIFIKNFLL